MITKEYRKSIKSLKITFLLAISISLNTSLKAIDMKIYNHPISSNINRDTTSCYFQKDTSGILYTAEKMPEFPGGIDSLYKFIGNNIIYSNDAIRRNIEGTVIVNFFVEVDGSVKNPHILKGLDSLLDKEAVRVVGILPKWTAGEQDGKRVRVAYSIPIVFKLSNGIDVNPDKNAEFPGGNILMNKFIARNTIYPKQAIENGITGIITAIFIVDTDGNICNIHCLPHEYGILENEAIRVIKMMPKWKPAIKNGKKVNSYGKIPFVFSLHE